MSIAPALRAMSAYLSVRLYFRHTYRPAAAMPQQINKRLPEVAVADAPTVSRNFARFMVSAAEPVFELTRLLLGSAHFDGHNLDPLLPGCLIPCGTWRMPILVHVGPRGQRLSAGGGSADKYHALVKFERGHRHAGQANPTPRPIKTCSAEPVKEAEKDVQDVGIIITAACRPAKPDRHLQQGIPEAQPSMSAIAEQQCGDILLQVLLRRGYNRSCAIYSIQPFLQRGYDHSFQRVAVFQEPAGPVFAIDPRPVPSSAPTSRPCRLFR